MPATDMRALGRVGDPLRSGRRPGLRGGTRRRAGSQLRNGRSQRFGAVARPRRRVPRGVALALAVVLAALVWVGAAASRQRDALADAPAAPAPAGALLPRVDAPARAGRSSIPSTQVFAEVQGLFLAVPGDDPVAVAFHEATQPAALTMAPLGKLEANDNPTKFTPAPDREGPGYRVLSSRGRARPATSAADIVLELDQQVVAPVSGRVVEVREYALYGKLRDWRIVVEPEGRPDLQVVLVHLSQPKVRVDDVVRAGVSPLATVRPLPFTSQVDYTIDEPRPHVHLEVKPAVPAEPFDPNAPALPPSEGLDTAIS